MRLEEPTRSGNAVGMALLGDGWLTHDANSGLVSATGWLTAPGGAAILALVKDGAFFGRQLTLLFSTSFPINPRKTAEQL